MSARYLTPTELLDCRNNDGWIDPVKIQDKFMEVNHLRPKRLDSPLGKNQRRILNQLNLYGTVDPKQWKAYDKIVLPDSAEKLVQRGLAVKIDGIYVITKAGRDEAESQLRHMEKK
jgi:hypothetical protein